MREFLSDQDGGRGSIIYLSAFPISSFCSVPMTETCFLLRL
jgi:hypothetical protein